MTTCLRRLLALWRPRGPLLLATALMALTVAAGVALMGTSTWLIATAAGHPSIAVLQVAVVGVRGFGIGRAVLRYLERLVAHDATLRVLARLRQWVFARAIPLAPAGFTTLHSGDVFTRMSGDVDALDHAFLRIAGPSLAAVVVASAATAVLALFDASLAAVVGTGLALGGGAIPWLAARAGSRHADLIVRLLARLQVSAVDTVQGLADLLVLGRRDDHVRRLEAAGRDLEAAQVRSAATAAAGGAFAGLAADLTVVAVIAVAAGASARLDGVEIAVAAMIALASFEAVAGLPGAFQRLGGIRQAGRRLCELADIAPQVVAPRRPRALPPGSAIQVQHLTFAYPGEPEPVLRDVSLSIVQGRATAIVGQSGGGKSTILNLLLRFWDVPAGTVFLGGVDVRHLDPDGVRARCALVSQRTHLFTGTIRDNLLMARPAATGGEMMRAAARAALHEVVASWPHGYDTWIGDQGLRMSGGERRRLALARAFLQDAPVLLLDEPTADLDVTLEGRVLEEIVDAARDRAVLLVTHRLVGLGDFAEILVLDGGRVVERGTFAALEAARGQFRASLDVQRGSLAIEGVGRE